MRKLLNKLKSFDLVVILFCILTGVYIILGSNQLQNTFFHLLIRVLFISLILTLISVEKSSSKLLSFIRNFYPLLLLGFFYAETDYYNNILFENLDSYLIKIENLVFGSQLSLDFSVLIPYRWFSELMYFGYFSYYLFTLGIPLLFYIKKKQEFNKAMFLIISSFCAYYILFILFPSIGPQFYFEPDQVMVPDGYIFDKVMHLVVKYGETETGAFPSSHVGMTVVFLILIWKNFRNYFAILLIPAFLLILSTVYLKAHYAIDIIAGGISGVLFYIISLRTYNTLNKQND
jgi:membrane-associated phospholipid phosphatase